MSEPQDHLPAPWTPEQIKNLNDYQHCGVMHPYTCGGNRSDEAHVKYAKEHHEDEGTLIATSRGWKCPVCDYKQEWSWNGHASGEWKKAFARNAGDVVQDEGRSEK
jgi:hypothetical protein